MKQQKLYFENASGQRLAALLNLPVASEPISYALFAHCFTCTKNLSALNHICRALTERGFAVFRFDFTGLGESEGDFPGTNFSSNIADLVSTAHFLASEYRPPTLLIGHSLGGAAALIAAGRIPSIRAVAVIGSPADPRHVLKHISAGREMIEKIGEAEIMLAGRPFRIQKQFIDDIKKKRMTDAVQKLKKPLMILHSPMDETVNIENAGRIFQTARHPKSFVSLDQADHLLTRKTDALFAGEMIAAWANQYTKKETATP